MPAPIIYSTSGATLSGDEIAFAHQVAASFILDMNRGWIKIVRRTDPNTNATVEYHSDKNIAYVTPGGAIDYVGMTMPNPVPYRGVSIGVAGGVTYVMASDGEVLASEALVEDAVYRPRPDGSGFYDSFSSYLPMSTWNGGGSVWMGIYDHDFEQFKFVGAYHHNLEFTVPEDCVYPPPAPTAGVNPAVDDPSTDAQWAADWAAGVEAFNARRKAWFKKNSDEFIAALKTGFAPGTTGVTRAELQTGALPASWDYEIKEQVENSYPDFALLDGSYAGDHTVMPIEMTISYLDVVLSDTSAGLTQAGTKITERTTTFTYIDADGVTQLENVVGTLTQVVTDHTVDSVHAGFSRLDSYLDWYTPDAAPADEARIGHQFIGDMTSWGIGLLWNGTVQTGYNADSGFGAPGDPLDYTTYTPPYPAYSNTLVGTAATLYLQYHNGVKPVYVKNVADSSTVMNNSAMYGVREVHISPVGLIADGAGYAATDEAVGMFSVDEDGTQVEIYGTAVYIFNWADGSLTFNKWKPLVDGTGTEVASKVVDLPAGSVRSDNPINCIVTYKGLHWPDILEYVRLRDADAKAGTFAKSDPIWWEIVQAIKAG